MNANESYNLIRLDTLVKIFSNGVSKIKNNKMFLVFAMFIYITEIIVVFAEIKSAGNNSFGLSFTEVIGIVNLVLIIIVADSGMLFILGAQRGMFKHGKQFAKIGIHNKKNELPLLVSKTKQGQRTLYEYYTNGIPLSAFQDKQDEIEAALNINIIDIKNGYDKKHIIITARHGSELIPDMVEWGERYVPDGGAVIALGVGIDGVRTVDLDIMPHVQCGGITGSGKTILLKCVLHQLTQKGFYIILCDFKNFLDFPKSVRKQYDCVDSKEALSEKLDSIVKELNRRKRVFAENDCANITEFNYKYPADAMQHIMIASDEIAYAFEKKGLKGEAKELVEKIETKMTYIAQQGRALGIHLWLSTQRGDAETIPGQIRSNLTVRICGRASQNLSMLTVDSTLAAEIPKSLRGRFVDDAGEYFQGFYYVEGRY